MSIHGKDNISHLQSTGRIPAFPNPGAYSHRNLPQAHISGCRPGAYNVDQVVGMRIKGRSLGTCAGNNRLRQNDKTHVGRQHPQDLRHVFQRVKHRILSIQPERAASRAGPDTAIRNRLQIIDGPVQIPFGGNHPAPGNTVKPADAESRTCINAAVPGNTDRRHCLSQQAVFVCIIFPTNPIVGPHPFVCTEPHRPVFSLGHTPETQTVQLGKRLPPPRLRHRIGIYGLVGLYTLNYPSHRQENPGNHQYPHNLHQHRNAVRLPHAAVKYCSTVPANLFPH